MLCVCMCVRVVCMRVCVCGMCSHIKGVVPARRCASRDWIGLQCLFVHIEGHIQLTLNWSVWSVGVMRGRGRERGGEGEMKRGERERERGERERGERERGERERGERERGEGEGRGRGEKERVGWRGREGERGRGGERRRGGEEERGRVK